MRNTQQGGFSLIEVIVTVSILSVGLLGLAGLQLRALNAEAESFARGQALMLVDQMAERILTRKSVAETGAYDVGGSPKISYGTGNTTACGGLAGAELDLCEWNADINAGTTAVTGTGGGRVETAIGTLHNPIGCVTWDSANLVYVVSMTWWAKDTVNPSTQPTIACDPSAIPAANRRTVIRTVRMATLGA